MKKLPFSPVYLFVIVLSTGIFTDCHRKVCKATDKGTITTKMDSTLDTMVITGNKKPLPVDSFEMLRYSRGACFGHCPVYSITVFGDGKLEYKASMFTKRKGLYIGQLSEGELEDLKQQIEIVHFISLSPMYPVDQSQYIPDLPNKEITIKYSSWMHKVIDNHSAPEALKALEQTLDNQLRYHASLKPAKEKK